jgi:hypothetical protein
LGSLTLPIYGRTREGRGRDRNEGVGREEGKGERKREERQAIQTPKHKNLYSAYEQQQRMCAGL